MENKKTPEKAKMNRNNRILIIFICIFTSLVLVFGIVFGTITIIGDMNTAVKLGNVSAEEGTVRVLASYYKGLHITALKRSGYPEARDTESFWNSVRREDGKTQGEIYLSSLKNYIAGIMAGCDLVKDSGGITDKDETYIKEKTNSFISYYGSEEEFNRVSSEFGFDYDDFIRAMELSYTSTLAFARMYGYNGANLKAGSAEAVASCEKYLSTYSRVKLLFLCDETITEENEDGDYEERELTEAEKEKRREMANELREAIAKAERGESGMISEIMFDHYLKDSDGDPEKHSSGYYFNEKAVQTSKFSIDYPEVVTKALEMNVGEYAEVNTKIGVCFIYKCEPEKNAYKNEDDQFFSDFYADAAAYFYTQAIEILAIEADFREKYENIDFISIPVNNKLFVTNWN